MNVDLWLLFDALGQATALQIWRYMLRAGDARSTHPYLAEFESALIAHVRLRFLLDRDHA